MYWWLGSISRAGSDGGEVAAGWEGRIRAAWSDGNINRPGNSKLGGSEYIQEEIQIYRQSFKEVGVDFMEEKRNR